MESRFKFDDSGSINTECLNAFEISSVLRGNLSPMVNLLPSIAHSDLQEFPGVPEEYKMGEKVMQMTMQYLLYSIQRLQQHLYKLRQDTLMEKETKEKLREIRTRQHEQSKVLARKQSIINKHLKEMTKAVRAANPDFKI